MGWKRALLKLWVKIRYADRGATSIEYALIAVGVSIAIAGAVLLVGGAVEQDFDAVAAKL